MLFKPEDLSYGYNPIQEAANILNESVYLNENETILSPMAVPVVEDREYIDGYNVDFHFVKRISEDYGLDYIDSLDFIAESNGIHFEDLDIIVQESEIIMDPYSLSPLSNHIKIAPVNEQSFSYQYCEMMLEAFLESGNMDILDMILDESLSKKIAKNVGSNLSAEKSSLIADLDRHLANTNIPGIKKIDIKPVSNPKTGNVLLNNPGNAGVTASKPKGFISRAENPVTAEQRAAEKQANRTPEKKFERKLAGETEKAYKAGHSAARKEQREKDKRTKEEARKAEAEKLKNQQNAFALAQKELTAKGQAEEAEAARKAEETKKAGEQVSKETKTTTHNTTTQQQQPNTSSNTNTGDNNTETGSNEQKVKETLNKAVEQAKDKSPSWISQKIQAFRNLYKKYMEKAKSAIDQKKASIFQRIAHFILNIIDTLASKLQSATA